MSINTTNNSTEFDYSRWVNEPGSSIFIPRIHYDISKQNLRDYFDNLLKIGEVSRVEFVDVSPEKGSGRMAFVHFAYWYNNVNSISFRDALCQNQPNGVDYVYILEKLDKNYKNHTVLRILINKRPIPETTLNVHQLTDMFNRLNEELSAVRKQVQIQDEELKQVRNVV